MMHAFVRGSWEKSLLAGTELRYLRQMGDGHYSLAQYRYRSTWGYSGYYLDFWVRHDLEYSIHMRLARRRHQQRQESP